jgi:hypothetical protein
MTQKNDTTVEINTRLEAGNRCLFVVQKNLHFRMLSRNAKMLIYETIIRPFVTYASETWVIRKENERALNTSRRKILRKIYGPVNEGGHWIIRTNEELQELYWEKDLVAFVNKGWPRCLGRVERMKDNRVQKRMLYGRPGGRRKKGSPRLR